MCRSTSRSAEAIADCERLADASRRDAVHMPDVERGTSERFAERLRDADDPIFETLVLVLLGDREQREVPMRSLERDLGRGGQASARSVEHDQESLTGDRAES